MITTNNNTHSLLLSLLNKYLYYMIYIYLKYIDKNDQYDDFSSFFNNECSNSGCNWAISRCLTFVKILFSLLGSVDDNIIIYELHKNDYNIDINELIKYKCMRVRIYPDHTFMLINLDNQWYYYSSWMLLTSGIIFKIDNIELFIENITLFFGKNYKENRKNNKYRYLSFIYKFFYNKTKIINHNSSIIIKHKKLIKYLSKTHDDDDILYDMFNYGKKYELTFFCVNKFIYYGNENKFVNDITSNLIINNFIYKFIFIDVQKNIHNNIHYFEIIKHKLQKKFIIFNKKKYELKYNNHKLNNSKLINSKLINPKSINSFYNHIFNNNNNIYNNYDVFKYYLIDMIYSNINNIKNIDIHNNFLFELKNKNKNNNNNNNKFFHQNGGVNNSFDLITKNIIEIHNVIIGSSTINMINIFCLIKFSNILNYINYSNLNIFFILVNFLYDFSNLSVLNDKNNKFLNNIHKKLFKCSYNDKLIYIFIITIDDLNIIIIYNDNKNTINLIYDFNINFNIKNIFNINNDNNLIDITTFDNNCIFNEIQIDDILTINYKSKLKLSFQHMLNDLYFIKHNIFFQTNDTNLINSFLNICSLFTDNINDNIDLIINLYLLINDDAIIPIVNLNSKEKYFFCLNIPSIFTNYDEFLLNELIKNKK